MIRKTIIIPAVAIAASGIMLLGASHRVHAQSPDNTPFSGLAQAIAQKFNLNQTDVENVIKQQMQANIQNRLKNRLDKLVTKGNINGSQEQAITAELAKIQSEYNPESLKNMTLDERKQTMQKMRDEITAWAQSQHIDPKYVMPGFGMRYKGWKNDPNMTPTPTS